MAGAKKSFRMEFEGSFCALARAGGDQGNSWQSFRNNAVAPAPTPGCHADERKVCWAPSPEVLRQPIRAICVQAKLALPVSRVFDIAPPFLREHSLIFRPLVPIPSVSITPFHPSSTMLAMTPYAPSCVAQGSTCIQRTLHSIDPTCTRTRVENHTFSDTLLCHFPGDNSARHIRPVELPLPLSTTDPPTSPITCDSLDANGGVRGIEKNNDRPDNGGGGKDVGYFHPNCGPNPHCILPCNFTDNCISISTTISNFPRGLQGGVNISFKDIINYKLPRQNTHGFGPDTPTLQQELVTTMGLGGMRYCDNFKLNDSFGGNDTDSDPTDNGGGWNGVYYFHCHSGPILHCFLLCTDNAISISMTISNFHGGFNFNFYDNINCNRLCNNIHELGFSWTIHTHQLDGDNNIYPNLMTTSAQGIITGQSRTVTVSLTSKVPAKTPRYE